jgi:hypothetical protein
LNVIVITSSVYADRRRLDKRIFSVVAGSCFRISVHIAAVRECVDVEKMTPENVKQK